MAPAPYQFCHNLLFASQWYIANNLALPPYQFCHNLSFCFTVVYCKQFGPSSLSTLSQSWFLLYCSILQTIWPLLPINFVTISAGRPRGFWPRQAPYLIVYYVFMSKFTHSRCFENVELFVFTVPCKKTRLFCILPYKMGISS